MPSRFAIGKRAIAECDRCGQQYLLSRLKPLVIKTKLTNNLCCPTCWDADQPQLQLGLYPVNDPQALRNPRPDTSYLQGGNTGLQLTANDFGGPSGGSRDIQWGWAPVGMNNPLGLSGLQSTLEGSSAVGTVTVTIS